MMMMMSDEEAGILIDSSRVVRRRTKIRTDNNNNQRNDDDSNTIGISSSDNDDDGKKRSSRDGGGRVVVSKFVVLVLIMMFGNIANMFSVYFKKIEMSLQQIKIPSYSWFLEWLVSQPTPVLCEDEITKNITDDVGGGLFYCGWNNNGTAIALFPDYANRSFDKLYGGPSTRCPTNQDILVFGMHGPCLDAQGIVNHYNPLDFPGKILFIQGESHGGDWTRALYYTYTSSLSSSLSTQQQQQQSSLTTTTTTTTSTNRTPHHAIEDVYQIGMLPDTTHSVLAYYGIVVLYNKFTSLIPTLIDPTQKPINTGDYSAIVYVAKNCIPYREEAAMRLSTILPIHYGSKCQGTGCSSDDDDKRKCRWWQWWQWWRCYHHHNSGGIIEPMPELEQLQALPRDYSYLIPFYSKYKFCLVMENKKESLYVTEKIVIAFLAGCIPIYYGADDVFDIFNRNAFIYYNVLDPQQPGAALDQIQYLANNNTAYLEMLQLQLILANGEETVRDYFSFSDTVGGGHVKHKLRKLMGV